MVEILKDLNHEKTNTQGYLIGYIATHALIITEQTLAQCYSSRFGAIC